MSVPNDIATTRLILLGQSSITSLLLPQDSIPSLTVAPIFALGYPRKEAGKPLTGYTGHDWAALLQAKSVRIVVIRPSGRIRSGGDESRAPWSRRRQDIECYGRTEGDAMVLLDEVEAFLKSVSNARAVHSGGTALVRDYTVEGGPLQFPDPVTEAPEAVGIYGASFIETFVA